ncbi:MAG: hypothetical protein DRN90_08020 [Thermoproteota archaeon]|nr:MAG: hypothetical protein DRN90_08020 [Candidatus Korarchaeota archaeon]
MNEINGLLSRLPPELEKFLEGDSVTLLIKGAPGTGKTTLALEILKVMSEKGESTYLSTRLSLEKISRQFPWIKEDLSFEKLGFELLSDVRLITPEYFITNLGKIIRRTKGCIVLDSWDAIANELDPKERLKVEKALVSMADSSGSRLIFISEEFGHQSLEYVADGVVTLRHIWVFGEGTEETHSPFIRRRSAREIELEKLRGVPIYQRTYLFTLSGGRFTCLLPYRPEIMTGSMEAIPDLDDWHISTGIPRLDETSKGLPKRRFFLLEIGRRVGLRFYPLLFTMVQNTILSGRGAIMLSSFLPPPEFRKSVELSEMGSFRSTETRRGAFKMIFLGQTYEETAVNYTREYERLRHQHQEVIEFIDLNAIESKFGLKETVSFLSDTAIRAFESNMPSVLLAREGMAALELTSRLVAAHVVIDDVNGALVTYGISPRSGLYGIITRKDKHHLIELM